MPKVFLCYRRDDTRGYSGRLYDGLAARWGKKNVVLDVYGIPPGEDYFEYARRMVAESDCVLVLIGRRWTEPPSLQRLADPEDLLRVEIETALGTNRRVIPVLIEGARMPAAGELPPELRELAGRNAFIIDDSGWDDDLRRLVREIEGPGSTAGLAGRMGPAARLVGAAVVVLLAARELPRLWPGKGPGEETTGGSPGKDAVVPDSGPGEEGTGTSPAGGDASGRRAGGVPNGEPLVVQVDSNGVPSMLGPYPAMSPAAEDVYYYVLPDGSVRFLDGWDERNIVRVRVPQLARVPGGPPDGVVRFYREAAPSLIAAWAEIEREGLLDRVVSWDGAYVPRVVRGGRTLSNHAMGTAFAVNARANPLGVDPAPAGAPGSVRELVPILEKHGFRWEGGSTSRPYGGKFEWVGQDST